MKAVVYKSTNKTLSLAIEEIKKQLICNRIIDDFDLVVLAVNYKYPYKNLDKTLKEVFNLEKK